MSIFERLNPLRIVRAADAVPRLQSLGGKLRDDQKDVARQLRVIVRQLEHLEQTLEDQKQVLAGVPELQDKIQQCVTAYTHDVRYADHVSALRDRLGDGTRLASHAASAVAGAKLELDPCPHIVIDDLLPDDVCGELVSAIPSSVFFKSRDRVREELGVPFEFAPEYSRLVWGHFYDHAIAKALVSALTEKFRPALDEFVRTHWPGLGSMAESGIRLRVSNSRLLLRRPGYVIKPHRDPRWAFLTCLVYLPRPSEPQSYGTQFYRIRREPEITHSSPLWVDPSECEFVKDVPSRRNTAVVFLNSTGAHGASVPVDAPPGTERYVYQVQFGVDDEMKRKLIARAADHARPGWAMPRGEGYS
jgi:hypothetical protein